MNVKALQRTDHWLGVPLCCGLTVVRAVFGRAAGAAAPPPRKLLLVKLAEQGSTVLAWTAVRRAVEMVGRENVYFLVFEENRFILDALGLIPEQNVIVVSAGGLPALARGIWSAVRRLRALKIDAAVDLEFFSRGSAALAFLSGARRRAGFHAFHGAGPYRGNLMTHRLLYNPHLSTGQTFLTLVEAVTREPRRLPTLAAPAPIVVDEPAQFTPAPGEAAGMLAWLRGETGGAPPLILLNPNCGDLLPLRRWPAERYVELARGLLAKYPELRVGFTGAPGEAGAVGELARQAGSPRCVSLAGKTTLRQLLVLYTLADVLVTNDSGPAHFATLTPIQVVTLFGPETPELFAARTPRNTVVWARLACSPCVSAYNNRQSPCRDNQCMQAITVAQVFAHACRAYELKRAAVRPRTAAAES